MRSPATPRSSPGRTSSKPPGRSSTRSSRTPERCSNTSPGSWGPRRPIIWWLRSAAGTRQSADRRSPRAVRQSLPRYFAVALRYSGQGPAHRAARRHRNLPRFQTSRFRAILPPLTMPAASRALGTDVLTRNRRPSCAPDVCTKAGVNPMKDRLRRAALRATGGNVSHRLCLAALCLFIAAITARTTGLIFPVAIEATQAPAAKPAAPQTVTVQVTRPPATPEPIPASRVTPTRRSSLKGTPHGQAKNPRTPTAAHGCESCHGPGQAHVDDEDNGTDPEVQGDDSGGVEPDLPDLPQPRQPRRLGRQRTRAAEPLVHDLPQRAQPEIVRDVSSSRPTRPRCAPSATACRSRRPNARSRTCRCARARWPARRATTRTAPSTTSRP